MGVVPFLLLFFVQTPYGDRKPTAHWGYPEPTVLRPQKDMGARRGPRPRRAEAPAGSCPPGAAIQEGKEQPGHRAGNRSGQGQHVLPAILSCFASPAAVIPWPSRGKPRSREPSNSGQRAAPQGKHWGEEQERIGGASGKHQRRGA